MKIIVNRTQTLHNEILLLKKRWQTSPIWMFCILVKTHTVMHTLSQPLLVHSHLFTHISLFSLSVPHLVFSDLFFCPASETSSPHIIPSLSGFNRGVRTFPVLKAHSHASISRNQCTISLLCLDFFCSAWTSPILL